MRKRLFAVVSATFLFPFAYPHSALSWNWNALSCQEATWMCGTGNLQACEVMYAFEIARSGAVGDSQVSGGGGSPANSVPMQYDGASIRQPQTTGISVALQPPPK